MSEGIKRLPLAEAKKVAEELVEEMHPYCDRIAIAGSIRREKEFVNDIEIVAIPKHEERAMKGGLFAIGMEKINVLYKDWAIKQKRILWIKPGKLDLEGIIAEHNAGAIQSYEIGAENLYWRGLLPETIKLDLFLTTEEKWAQIFTIRTGSAEFTHALVTHANFVRHTPIKDGRVFNYGRPVEGIKTEKDLFAYLNLEWVEPRQRTGREALKFIRYL